MSRLFSDVLPEWPLDEVEGGLASATETDVLAALELAENRPTPERPGFHGAGISRRLSVS